MVSFGNILSTIKIAIQLIPRKSNISEHDLSEGQAEARSTSSLRQNRPMIGGLRNMTFEFQRHGRPTNGTDPCFFRGYFASRRVCPYYHSPSLLA